MTVIDLEFTKVPATIRPKVLTLSLSHIHEPIPVISGTTLPCHFAITFSHTILPCPPVISLFLGRIFRVYHVSVTFKFIIDKITLISFSADPNHDATPLSDLITRFPLPIILRAVLICQHLAKPAIIYDSCLSDLAKSELILKLELFYFEFVLCLKADSIFPMYPKLL